MVLGQAACADKGGEALAIESLLDQLSAAGSLKGALVSIDAVACNPKIAHEALGLELEIGALLPCNVIVYQNDKGGTNIAFMDPLIAMESTGNKGLAQHAKIVRDKLMSVAKKLE